MIVLSNVTAPSEGVRLSIPDVKAYAENIYGGEGRLTVSESVVVWISNETNQGFCLMYPSIILHAVSRDFTAFPEECIYILVDANKSDLHLVPEQNEAHSSGSGDGMGEEGSDGNDEDTDEGGSQVALRFVPRDKSLLSEIYNQLSECQALNPDEEDDFSEEDGNAYEDVNDGNIFGPGGETLNTFSNDQWYTSESQEAVHLNPEGLANLQRILANSNGQVNSTDGNNVDDEQMDQD